jgi:hypothetical protein
MLGRGDAMGATGGGLSRDRETSVSDGRDERMRRARFVS